MAPPVTPSPRRFLPGPKRQTSPNKPSKAPPRFSQNAASHQGSTAAATPQQQITQQPPAPSQFAPTPRFSHARSKASSDQQTSTPASPPRPSLAQALRPPRPREDVEETHSSDNERDSPPNVQEGEGEMLLTTTEPSEQIHHSIEPHDHSPTTRTTANSIINPATNTTLPFSPKRRRLSSPPNPRFALPASNSPSASAATATTNPTRPSFLRPPTPPSAAPIPQTFSPHRRGTAFLPGGVASTVQAWVVAAGQSFAQEKRARVQYQNLNQNHQQQQQQQQQRQDQAPEDGWGFRVRVLDVEVVEGKGWRVLGLREEGVEEALVVRCLLVGEGKGNVRVGGMVGVRSLGWRVCLSGERERQENEKEDGKEEEWWVAVGWEGG